MENIIIGQKFNYWEVVNKDSNKRNHWFCRCKCGKEKSVRDYDLLNNKTKQCKSCYAKSKEIDLNDQKFGRWLVLNRSLNKKGYWDCKCECGIKKTVSLSSLRSGDSKSCFNCALDRYPREDLTDRKFGQWTVLFKDLNHKNSKILTYWLCKCDCSLEKSIYGSHLISGRSYSCRGCSENKDKGRIPYRIISRIKYGAKKRNLLFDLGNSNKEISDFLYDLLNNKQNSKCKLSGIDIKIAPTINRDIHGETTASLDRIDSSKGYTKDNVQWVHKDINFMKQDFTQQDFIDYCKKVAANN